LSAVHSSDIIFDAKCFLPFPLLPRICYDRCKYLFLESMKFCDQIKSVPARLVLQNGEVYEGVSPQWSQEETFGEVVFTTGMTGYVESLTDPSFAGQILVFTFPLIGNYGVPEKKWWESSKIHVRGAIFNEIAPFCDHYQAVKSLEAWLREENIPYMSGVDTRALTKSLRTQGSALGAITKGRNPLSFPDPNQTHLVASVSTKKVVKYGKGKKKIIAIDCGMKENILRCLLEFPLEIKRVPHDYDYSEEEFDGVFISNGPGDPIVCKETVTILQKVLKKKKPIFGICLGAQLLALAIGAKTYKLLYGHRGQNQGCEDLDSGRCYLTSQNHGYAIDEKTLPKDWRATFRHLNDSSVEGIAHRSLPFFAVQFHPEASPGPVDTLWLFEKFYELLGTK
jgi:carbamoyl-phosphate synthase small subunit